MFRRCALCALCIQKQLGRLVVQFEGAVLSTDVAKGVRVLALSKRVKGADEDDVGLVEFIVGLALADEVHIDHGLIVTGTFGQLRFELVILGIGGLHLYVIDGIGIILDIDIEPDTFAVGADIDGLFVDRKGNLFDLDLQDFFDEFLADALILHDLLEKKIVLDGEFIPGFYYSTPRVKPVRRRRLVWCCVCLDAERIRLCGP